MKENGFNCALVNLSFSYLSDPDDLSQVNASELEQLDEVISWAAERGIHVIISCLGIPGYRFEDKVQYMYSTTESVNRVDCPLWSDQKTQKQFEQYWEMLAARYASIDPKLLSFELVWEPSINDMAMLSLPRPIFSNISYRMSDIAIPTEGFIKPSLSQNTCKEPSQTQE